MKLIGIVSLSAAIVGFILFMHVLHQTNDLVLARSVAFAGFGLTTVFYVYSVKTLKDPVRSESPLNNVWLLGAWIIDLALVLAPYFITPLGDFLDVVPIGHRWWWAIASALAVVVIIEVFKMYFKHKSSKA
jgi:magnesium-transporting ATPase (P-type)